MTGASEASPDPSNRDRSSFLILLSGLVFGLFLRVVQLGTSIGTVDVANWLSHLRYVSKLGLLHVYEAPSLINHPTLALAISLWTLRGGARLGLEFYDSFRLLMSFADVVTACALYSVARLLGHRGPWVALLFFLSPAAIFISAFHCNSDPLMVMFVVLALLACIRRQPILTGLLIGAAFSIKIIAFVAFPVLLFFFTRWSERFRVAVSAGLVGVAVFVPPLFASGSAEIGKVFGYRGWPEAWGLRILVNLAGLAVPALRLRDPASLATVLLLVSLFAIWGTEAWRSLRAMSRDPRQLVTCVGLLFVVVLVLGPGFGVQYLMWCLPFLAFLLTKRAAVLIHGGISFFLFAVYTSWCGGTWPWTWANASLHEKPAWIGMVGLAVWASLGWTAWQTARSYYGRKQTAD
jgi:hypothetical protein